MKLYKRDFDKAVKQSWSCSTCILAQCMIRNNIPFGENGHTVPLDGNLFTPAQQEVRRTFDKHFNYPSDKNKPELVALRALLPI